MNSLPRRTSRNQTGASPEKKSSRRVSGATRPRSRLQEQRIVSPEQHEGVARIGIQRLSDHHPGLRKLPKVLEAREPDPDVDVARDLLIRETEFVGGAPDVGPAASDRPRARRHRCAPDQSRAADVPTRPTCRQRGLRAHHTGADGQRAHQSHGGQSSAPNPSCRQNASPGNLSRASPQRASRPCWPTGRVAFQTPQLWFVSSQADSAGKSSATWTDPRKIQHLPRFDPVELGLEVGLNGFRHSNNYTNRGWAREIITTS